MLVLIDNGHGEETPGKRSPDGKLLEYKWAREVAHLLSGLLDGLGIENKILVPETGDIPLSERVRRANAYSNAILVSIHCNAFGMGNTWEEPKGWSIYTSIGETKADVLAKCIYDKAVAEFDDRIVRAFSPKAPDYEESLYILRKTRCPAVLVENFFMDNRDDCKFLLSDEGKERCAKVIAYGIETYLKQK